MSKLLQGKQWDSRVPPPKPWERRAAWCSPRRGWSLGFCREECRSAEQRSRTPQAQRRLLLGFRGINIKSESADGRKFCCALAPPWPRTRAASRLQRECSSCCYRARGSLSACHMHARAHTCIHTHTRTHIHVHTHTHACMHAHTQLPVSTISL